MNEMWQKIVNLIKRIANHPDTREFAEDLRKFVVEKMILWLEGVLQARSGTGLAVA